MKGPNPDGLCKSCGRMLFPNGEHRFFVWLGYEIAAALVFCAVLFPLSLIFRSVVLLVGLGVGAYALKSSSERSKGVCPGCGNNIHWSYGG